jgi:hypothetical protein
MNLSIIPGKGLGQRAIGAAFGGNMIDTATNWFYGERRLSAGAAIENLRHDLWAY